MKDPGLARLLRELARGNRGLCVVTTRLEVDDWPTRGATVAGKLETLSPQAGEALLRKLGVRGAGGRTAGGRGRYGGHALALRLWAAC